MSEIEKMYDNAGIKMEFAYLECHRGKSSICCPIEEYEKDDECMGCINSSAMKKVYEYPPFTAEKQLKILCFIVNNKHSVTFHDQVFGGDKLTLEKIQENLAWAINRIWQDLTEEEKEALRGILRA